MSGIMVPMLTSQASHPVTVGDSREFGGILSLYPEYL